MNDTEERLIKQHVIKAIEDYLNNHSYSLDREMIAPATSAYFGLDHYKDELIKEVYQTPKPSAEKGEYETMSKEKAFCEKCDNDVFFDVKVENREAKIRGIKVVYTYYKGVCKKCGEQVFPISLGRKNQISMYDAYKKMGLANRHPRKRK